MVRRERTDRAGVSKRTSKKATTSRQNSSSSSTERSFGYWAALAGYKGQPSVQAVPDGDTTNKQTITRYTFRQAGKPEVTLLKVDGGEHAFPQDLDIFLESWAFFQREIQRLDRR